MIAPILAALIADNDGITTQLAVYEDAPAIFTGGMPDDASLPAIDISALGGSDDSVQDARGAALSASVQVFGPNGFSRKATRDLAWALWRLINRADISTQLAAAGFDDLGCVCDPPLNTQDGLGMPGYTLRVTARVLESD